jgi:hypothetical protein
MLVSTKYLALMELVARLRWGPLQVQSLAQPSKRRQPLLPKRVVERISTRIKRLLHLMLEDAIAVDEGKAETKALDTRRTPRRHDASQRRAQNRTKEKTVGVEPGTVTN